MFRNYLGKQYKRTRCLDDKYHIGNVQNTDVMVESMECGIVAVTFTIFQFDNNNKNGINIFLLR